MKKNNILFIAFTILYSCFYMNIHGITRVIPVAYDQNQNQWTILMSKNVHDHMWNDFGHKNMTNSTQILSTYTNNVINQNNLQRLVGPFPYTNIHANNRTDTLYFAILTFIPGGTLYQNGRNQWKEDFRWMPASIMRNVSSNNPYYNFQFTRGPKTGQTDQMHFSSGFLHMLQSHWSDFLSATQQNITNVPQQNITNSPQQQSGGFFSNVMNYFGYGQQQQVINFYNQGQPYYEFTNFYAPQGGIIIDGQRWATTENYYQAQKFYIAGNNYYTNQNIYNQIRDTQRPRDAFDIAQQNKQYVRNDWQNVNLRIMLHALRVKFNEFSNLKSLLLSTGNAYLIEDSPNDDFYGIGAQRNGQNHLGKLLMHVRREILTGQEQNYNPQEW